MKLGAEDQKKIKALAVLGVILLGAVYYSFFSGPSTSVPKQAAAARDPLALDTTSIPTTSQPGPMRAPARAAGRSTEFHPVYLPKRKEDRVDPKDIDPDIKLYLLAKLQEVAPAGGGRNLFQFGPPPMAKNETIVKVATPVGPPPIPPDNAPPKPTPPPTPPPAPFNAKYYGLATSTANGRRRAFFLDGEDIIIRAEGETVKGHFRIVRIGVSSVVVEDTDSKRQQTIQIAEDAAQG